MSNIIQRTIDDFWAKTLFRVLPKEVKPNHFTVIRLVLVPFVLYFLLMASFGWALFWFLLAAFCDSVDGALARKRGQITYLGIILDPIADKLLVSLTVLFLAYYYPFPALVLAVVFIDALMGFGSLAYLAIFPKQKIQPANWPAKFKLFSQVAGIVLIFLWLIFKVNFILLASVWFLGLAIALAALSLVIYALRAFGKYGK